jgi:hypothetical protein
LLDWCRRSIIPIVLGISGYSGCLFADSVNPFQTHTVLQSLSGSTSDSYDSGLVSGPTTGDVPTQNCVIYGCTHAEAFGSAFAGKLGASALAAGSQQSTAGIIHAAASAQVSFNDFITLSGPGVSNGTPVDVVVNQSIVGTSQQQEPNDDQDYSYFGTVTSSFAGTDIGICVGSPGNNLTSCNVAVTTNVLHLSVGTVYPITGQLTATASITGSATVLMSYGDTAHYYLQPLTPGVTIQSASGYSYQAVPETRTGPAVASGFFVVLFFVARGRRILQRRHHGQDFLQYNRS